MLSRTRLGLVALLTAATVCAGCSGGPGDTAPGPTTGSAAPAPSSSAHDDGQGTTSAPQAAASLDLDAEVQPDGTILVRGDHASFLMPSTNLVCVLRPDGVICQIHEKHFTPAAADLAPDRSSGCTPQSADGLAITDGAPARWTCLPEDLRGWASVQTGGGWVGEGRGSTRPLDGTEHAVLPYGSTLRLGDLACESRREGVECSDLSTGRSLFLARERYGTG